MRNYKASFALAPFALIILLLFAAIDKCKSQNSFIRIDNTSNQIRADSIYLVNNLSKQDIYLNSKLWLSKYFKSSKAVIDFEDSGAGVIIGKGSTPIEVSVSTGLKFQTNCHYSFKMSAKDNKFRFEIYDISYKSNPKFVGGSYVESKETLPSFWFIPNLREGYSQTAESYRTETYRVISELFNSASSSILASKSSEW